MFLCLILLASSILAPGQSAPSPPHKAAAAAAAAGHGQKQVYADLMSKMDQFVAHVLAPLFSSGKCQKGTKEENVQVGGYGFGFDALERRCETAAVLDRVMAELRKEFEQHKGEKELSEDVKEKVGKLIHQIREKVYDYDVAGLEGKLNGMEEDLPMSRVEKLEAVIWNSMDGMDQGFRQGHFEDLNEATNQAMATFQERPNFETAYSLIHRARHSGDIGYVSGFEVQQLLWAMQTFKADLLVYDFLLQHEEEEKKKLEMKLEIKREKKQSGHEHGPVKQQGHNALECAVCGKKWEPKSDQRQN